MGIPRQSNVSVEKEPVQKKEKEKARASIWSDERHRSGSTPTTSPKKRRDDHISLAWSLKG